ncbi:MAG: hypothetical protein GVY29_06165 [Spirochaetes bacterium]|jgi:hypothetical protein|nr:hypothetical protein [Spirochaetota bacterium]
MRSSTPSATLLSDLASERARFRILLRDFPSCSFEAVSSISDLESSDIIILPARLLSDVIDWADHVFDTACTLVFGSPRTLAAAYLAGACDFMKAPWEPEELLFRLERLAGDAVTPDSSSSDLAGSFELDDVRIELTLDERRLFRALCEAPDGIASRRALAFAMGVNAPSSSRAVDMRIARLRKRLQPLAGYANPIVSVRGRGYRLNLHDIVSCG